MRKNKLMAGIAIGAVVGAALSMFDKETREQATSCLKKAKTQTQVYVKHPSQAARDARTTFENTVQTIDRTTTEAMSVLTKLEGYLGDTDSQQNGQADERL
ncbi:YtxH domain-containing protein [Pontibacillus litoralis]|uniref:YtxH domain-containing protein n=1 Tax=Pontibacillus litoralis JSM 072002 TaxID=1385512 RepID=A0A0A5GAM7_9BACI|nr:YtxH domain-containing protein [Pontibacillus litoralis]KGX88170.1 hypothetical protein N784_10550 [Pontibacillus litoralis JSM 072002]